MHTRAGRCFCGAVRFTVQGEASAVCICHCESCRRAAGAAMVPWATYPLGRLRITHGRMQLHQSSPGVTRGHCARCGTSITYQHEQRPGEIDVTLASLGDPPDLPPTFHVWTQDRLPWLTGSDGLPQYPQQMPVP